MRFATRLNSFASSPPEQWLSAGAKPTIRQLLMRAALVEGLTDVDLNYPDYFIGEGKNVQGIAHIVKDCGLKINGLAMRYYSDPDFKAGAFTHPDEKIRRKAIDLTKRGIDAARECGTNLMTLWLGQDGFDYSFQADYHTIWQYEIDGIREVAAHDPDCLISIEYKPNEPRAYALLPDCASTLLAITEVGLPNLGVTLDFAHVLYADEQPALAAALISRYSRILGLHLNDGYAKRDDGLMVGAVHAQQTIELLYQLKKDGYDGAIYFDTFPDQSNLDPVRECNVNIQTVKRMMRIVERLHGDNRLNSLINSQEIIDAQAIVQEVMLGDELEQ